MCHPRINRSIRVCHMEMCDVTFSEGPCHISCSSSTIRIAILYTHSPFEQHYTQEQRKSKANLKSMPQTHTFSMMPPVMNSAPERPNRSNKAVIKADMANMPRPLPLKAIPLARVRFFSKYCPTITTAGVKLRAEPNPGNKMAS